MRYVREIELDAAHLADRHFILFEVIVGNALLENADQHVVGELILIGEAGGGDSLEPLQESNVKLMPPGNAVERVIGQLVVVAIVSVTRGGFRRSAQIGLILLVKKGILGGQTVGNEV